MEPTKYSKLYMDGYIRYLPFTYDVHAYMYIYIYTNGHKTFYTHSFYIISLSWQLFGKRLVYSESPFDSAQNGAFNRKMSSAQFLSVYRGDPWSLKITKN